MMAAFTIIVVLVGLNALYVAAEFGAIAARRTRIRQAAESGSRTARWVLDVIESPARLDHYVAGCQVGITLTSLLLGAYAQAALAPVIAGVIESLGALGRSSALGATAAGLLVGVTLIQVMFGELLPKSIALQYPTQTTLYTAAPLRASLWLTRPLIALLNGSATSLLRLVGVRPGARPHVHSPEEIALLIAESQDGGLFSPSEQQRLDRALRLRVLPVRRLMVPRTEVVAVRASATLDEVHDALLASGFTRLPVYEEDVDRVVGVVHAKDVARRFAAGGTAAVASDLMRPIAHVPEALRADRLVTELRRQRSEQAVVIDEHGGVAGLITLEDVLVEVLGGVAARRPGDPVPEALADGRVRLPGRMRIHEAYRWLGVVWEGESDTLSGIVSEQLGRIPRAGDRLSIAGCDVEVEVVDRAVVASLLARPTLMSD
jgi:putative hemolysin